MPDFQNPTGRSMTRSGARRDPARGGARRTRCSCSTRRRPISTSIAVQSRPASATATRRRVVRIGSLGKTVWGGLRVGWIRAEARPRPPARRRSPRARPRHPRVRAGGRRGVLPRRLRRDHRAALDAPARRARRARRRARGSAAGVARAATSHGGVSLWIELDARAQLRARDGRALARACCCRPDRASRSTAATTATSAFPFTAPPDELARAVDLLAESWRRVRAGAPVSFAEQLESVV